MKSANESNTDYHGMNAPKATEPERGVGFELLHSLKASVIATFVLALIVSGFYPVIVWGLSQALFHNKANGSLIGRDGQSVSDEKDAVGSALLGQSFSDAKYFHPRPSAAGNGYDPTASSGSNLGPTSAKLMFGTTKNVAYTVFAGPRAPVAVVPVSGRVQGTVAATDKTSITVASQNTASTQVKYPLDPSVADPNATVNYHGRTIHATTIPAGSIVELKLNDKQPPAVVAINVADQELDSVVSATDTTANKITLNEASSTLINVDPKNTVFIVNGQPGKLDALTTGMSVHVLVSSQMDYDGIADRVIHYCQDNKIEYKSSVPESTFTDADGIDDQKLVTAFSAATSPTITPTKPIPADAVTASGSGLDPHISVENASIQAPRVAAARKIPVEKVISLIGQSTQGPDLGILGDPGVNVLKLNIALDNQ